MSTLYVVATPIGNLEDMTLRAIRILSEVDLILCEDTRHTVKLLNHLEIKKPLKSYHSYNEDRVVEQITGQLRSGKTMALVSDGGTPCISDPGSKLISKVREEGYDIVPIPGVSALITLLSICGFPTNKFQFIGFLSIKKNKRIKKLADLLNYEGLIILYESPHRIIKLLEEMAEIFPDCKVLIGRELTKKFESIYYGTAKELFEQKEGMTNKGEYTIIINNCERVS